MNTIIPDNSLNVVSTKGVDFESRILIDNPTGHSAAIKVDVTMIPQSFWKGLADCNSGRVIDMNRALEEPPPTAD